MKIYGDEQADKFLNNLIETIRKREEDDLGKFLEEFDRVAEDVRKKDQETAQDFRKDLEADLFKEFVKATSV